MRWWYGNFNLGCAKIALQIIKKILLLVIKGTIMATLLPPPSKRAKLAQPTQEPVDLSTVTDNVLCQFKASDTGEITGTTIHIPARTTAKELELLLNQLLKTVNSS